jgi:hypothetical protein
VVRDVVFAEVLDLLEKVFWFVFFLVVEVRLVVLDLLRFVLLYCDAKAVSHEHQVLNVAKTQLYVRV